MEFRCGQVTATTLRGQDKTQNIQIDSEWVNAIDFDTR